VNRYTAQVAMSVPSMTALLEAIDLHKIFGKIKAIYHE